MALLRNILLTFVVLAQGIALAATRTSIPMSTLESARMVLDRGDATRAKTVARGLRKQDPEVAALYSLEWVATRIEARSSRGAVSADTSEVLRWKASPEVWKDEWDSYRKMPRTSKTQAELHPNDEELGAIREVLLDSSLYEDEKILPELEQALVTLLYNEHVTGKNTDLQSRPKVVDFIDGASEKGVEKCQWRARKILTGKTLSALEAWKDGCEACVGMFCDQANLALADVFSENAKYSAALEIYQRVARSTPEPSMAVLYRVAALQILAAKPIENVLRAAAPVLADEESKSVTDAQRAAIRSYVCGEVASVARNTLNAMLRRIYTSRAWVQQARGWILNCGLNESKRIASLSELPQLSEVERESIRLAFQVRQSQEKSKDARMRRELDKAAAVDKALRSPPKDLGGVLQVPVLFPFPQLELKPAPYKIGTGFSGLSGEG